MKTAKQAKLEENFRRMFEDLEKTDEFAVEKVKIRVAEQIFRKMEEQNITKAMLAEKLGTSRAYITKVLDGSTNLTLESMVKISRALECELSFQLSPIYHEQVQMPFSIRGESFPSYSTDYSSLDPVEYASKTRMLVINSLKEQVNQNEIPVAA